ncbi:steroid 5-alpha reductase family enzyme [Pedobacter sp. UYP24]
MMSLLVTILICLAACCLIMAAVWVWAKRITNAGVVDVFWSFNFPVVAVLLYFLADGFELRKLLICGMVFIAGSRLGIHLWRRVIGHLDKEEGRYEQLRKEWAPKEDFKFFMFFQFQGISNVLLSAPFFLIAFNKEPQINVLEYIAIGIWLVAVVGEAISDWQLDQFKKDPKNKGEVCDIGLWNYSRHPNYFFQSLMWMAYFLFALTAPLGWIAVLSPAIILYLLFKVTGIPATEEQSLRSKGDKYRKYQKTTSVFVPWFKKS